MRWRGHVFGQRSVGSSSSSALAWSGAVGRGVDADGVESGVAEQLSDDDEVGAAADEGGAEGCGRWFGRPGPALSAIWRKMPLVAPAVVQCRATGPGGPFRTYSGRPPYRDGALRQAQPAPGIEPLLVL